MTDKKPFEIARETLQQLTVRKLPPPPGNYEASYNEIAGTPNLPPFPQEPLRQIAQSLPTSEFMEQIARMVENTLPALGSDDARFQEQVHKLLQTMRDPAAEVTLVKTLLANFSHRLSFAAEEEAEIKSSLLKLLHLIIQNIGELSQDDGWLKGQAEALMSAATPPLTLRRLDDVERRLKDVIFKQTEAKGRALEAQDELRKMLATFIERLSLMAESSSSFHGKMEESVRQLEQAKKIEEIAPVIKDVINATRVMAGETLSVRCVTSCAPCARKRRPPTPSWSSCTRSSTVSAPRPGTTH